MLEKLKISPHRHSGQLRPHEHTSYLPLAILVLVVGVVLALISFYAFANAATPYNGPEAGSIGLSGTMPAPPPKVAATISSPANGQHFTTSPITVKGTCPKDTLVEIYKNNIFAGSTPCDSNGTFSVQIDLLFGKNVLKAQVYDALNQAGPESVSVTVFYDASLAQAAPATFLNLTGAQLLLSTDAAFRGNFPNQTLNVPITVIGGTAPYAINVQWGDGTNQLISRSDNTTFNASHAYKKPGTYKITLQATDKNGLVAFLTVAAIINGKPDVLAASTSTNPPADKLLVLWPLFAIIATAVSSFWIGEKREKRILGVNKVPTPAFGAVAQTPAQPTT